MVKGTREGGGGKSKFLIIMKTVKVTPLVAVMTTSMVLVEK